MKSESSQEMKDVKQMVSNSSGRCNIWMVRWE